MPWGAAGDQQRTPEPPADFNGSGSGAGQQQKHIRRGIVDDIEDIFQGYYATSSSACQSDGKTHADTGTRPVILLYRRVEGILSPTLPIPSICDSAKSRPGYKATKDIPVTIRTWQCGPSLSVLGLFSGSVIMPYGSLIVPTTVCFGQAIDELRTEH